MLAGTWPAATDEEGAEGVDECARRLRDLVQRSCDAAMPRANPRPRRAAHWWSDEIGSLRQAAHEKRRALKRARRRRGNVPAAIERAAAEYRGAAKALRSAIAAAKAKAWEELLLTLDENPWGRPYLIVREKLKRWAPPNTEALEASVLARVLGALFPESTGEESPWEESPPQKRNEARTWRSPWRSSAGPSKGCERRTQLPVLMASPVRSGPWPTNM